MMGGETYSYLKEGNPILAPLGFIVFYLVFNIFVIVIFSVNQ